ncbi:hypothetical protein SHIRM173S_09238 [Streptomyces hirsutus]
MRPPGVHLREITDDNRDAVRALRVRRDQKQFVASVSKSLKEAARTPEANPWYRAVYRGDEPVGFVRDDHPPVTPRTEDVHVRGEQNNTLSYLPALAEGGVELAEIEHCAHFPMYSNPPQMWARIADLVSRSDTGS